MAKIIDHSDEVMAALKDAIEVALDAMGQQATSHAKANITDAGRINTGALRNSISHIVDSAEKAVYVGTNVEYAIYNELGTGIYIAGGRQSPWSYQDGAGNWHRTRGMPPIHFMKNAGQDHEQEYVNIAKEIISNKMK